MKQRRWDIPLGPPLSPRVIEAEPRARRPRGFASPAPQVIVTEQTERIVPADAANGAPSCGRAAQPARSRLSLSASRASAVLFAGWLAVDAVGWISAAFERSAALGRFAAARGGRRRRRGGRGDRARDCESVPAARTSRRSAGAFPTDELRPAQTRADHRRGRCGGAARTRDRRGDRDVSSVRCRRIIQVASRSRSSRAR